MKAAVYSRYGPPDVVRIVDVERPTAAANDVLVKVHAATVNRTDCGFRAAHPWFVRFFSGLTKPKATILGCEFAGEIEAFGRNVTAFEIGDRVFGFSEGQYLTMPQDGPIATIPPDLSFEETAPSTEGSHYALSLITRARIRGGQRVLVNGGTGAIGSAAIQPLKEVGSAVTAVADTEHLELVRGLGADRVVDRTVEDFTRDDWTDNVVIDAVGKSSFARCGRLLQPRGIYLSTDLGPLSQNPSWRSSRHCSVGGGSCSPSRRSTARRSSRGSERCSWREPSGRSSTGAIPWTVIGEAYRYVETGQKIGNVVITVP